jgi:high-affinity Fe2+/Pb2+ permease
MIDTNLFIGAIIIAIVAAIKSVFPQVSGAITTIVAVVVGVLVAILASQLGLASVSVAQGILDALAAAGVHTVASATGTKNSNS